MLTRKGTVIDDNFEMFQDVPIAPSAFVQSEQPAPKAGSRKAVWVEFAQVETAAAEKQQLQQRLDDLTHQRDGVWAEIAKLEASITAKLVLDARMSDISRGDTPERAAPAAHPELEKLHAAIAENADLHREVAALRKEHEAASAEVVRQRDAQCDEFHRQLEQLNNTVLALRARGERQQTEVAELAGLLDAQSDGAESVTAQLNALREQNAQLTARLEELAQRDAPAQAQPDPRIAQLESTLAELQVQYNNAHSAAHAAVAKLTTQLATLSEQYHGVAAQLSQLTKLRAEESVSSRAEIAKLTDELDSAYVEISRTRERAAKADEWRTQAMELRNKLIAKEIEQTDNSAFASKEGFSMQEVFAIADKLSQKGTTPTFASVRAELGKGSAAAIQVALTEWRMRRATRLPGV
jgi:DNA repair exonuclease SbcCD ATPase subunit